MTDRAAIRYRRLALAGTAVMLLTILHHAYGAWRYSDPWRHHVIPVALLIGLTILWLARRSARGWARRLLIGVVLVFPICWIGLFEGGYNHFVKLIVFAVDGGAFYSRLFPASIYERPDDWLFELTGVLQLVPAVVALVLLGELARARRTEIYPAAAAAVSSESNRISIRRFDADNDRPTVVALFRAYAASLTTDLSYQDFETELAELPGKYGAPHGAILLAMDAHHTALGCVAIRPLAAGKICEMKRLYVVPEGRGRGTGLTLAHAAIREATALGYHRIRLDTLPTMTAAIAMYRQLGFEEITPYYRPTPAGTRFMELRLS